MYAVVETGGKQYRVEEGNKLSIEKIEGAVGDSCDLEQVLLLGGEELKVGKPYVEGAKVRVKVLAQGRGKKIFVGKFKAKKGYKRKQGHRQPYTLVEVEAIQGQ